MRIASAACGVVVEMRRSMDLKGSLSQSPLCEGLFQLGGDGPVHRIHQGTMVCLPLGHDERVPGI